MSNTEILRNFRDCMNSLDVAPDVMVLSSTTLGMLESSIREDATTDDIESVIAAHLPHPVTIAVSNNVPEGEILFI